MDLPGIIEGAAQGVSRAPGLASSLLPPASSLQPSPSSLQPTPWGCREPPVELGCGRGGLMGRAHSPSHCWCSVLKTLEPATVLGNPSESRGDRLRSAVPGLTDRLRPLLALHGLPCALRGWARVVGDLRLCSWACPFLFWGVSEMGTSLWLLVAGGCIQCLQRGQRRLPSSGLC